MTHTRPTIPNIQQNIQKYIIVYNDNCSIPDQFPNNHDYYSIHFRDQLRIAHATLLLVVTGLRDFLIKQTTIHSHIHRSQPNLPKTNYVQRERDARDVFVNRIYCLQ